MLAALFACPEIASASPTVVQSISWSADSAQQGRYDDLSNKDQHEVKCLALAVYHESRGQPLQGQMAVAHSVVNRVQKDDYPDSVCAVVFQRYHGRAQYNFTVWNAARLAPRDRAQWSTACDVALRVYKGGGIDPTHGATSFYNPRLAHLSLKGIRFGDHIFYR